MTIIDLRHNDHSLECRTELSSIDRKIVLSGQIVIIWKLFLNWQVSLLACSPIK